MINLEVKDLSGNIQRIEVPEDINLSLMEVLRASEYNIPATCGGMALCATCHIEILDGDDNLGQPTDAELDMIDSLPNAVEKSRLACQIIIGSHLEGLFISLRG